MFDNIKISIAALAALMCAPVANAAFDNDPYFSDIALINCGKGIARPTWTKADLEPYVTHKFADGHEAWFFDAFLFVDTQREFPTTGMVKIFGNDIDGMPSTRADWDWMMDQYYDPELKLHALDDLIEEKKQTLGALSQKHAIVLALCLPTKYKGGSTAVWSKKPWGRLDRTNVTIETDAMRLKVVQWYVDRCIERFNLEGYKNLKLVGFYWVEEGLYTLESLAPKVSDYIRSRGMRTYWIPYYPKGNETSWRKAHSTYKFDMTYLQPNYAFYKDDNVSLYTKQTLIDCINAAKSNNFGVEFEFETEGYSNAMYAVSPSLHQRIRDYMSYFRSMGAVANGGIAYYTGSKGLIHMDQSTNATDHATMDMLANMVNERQRAKGITSAPVTGNPGATTTLIEDLEPHTMLAYTGPGHIYVTDIEPDIAVFDIAGRMIHVGEGQFECPAGIYIVKAPSGKTMKLQVR